MAAVSTFVAAGALASGVYSSSEQSKAGKAAAAAGREGAILQAVNAGKEAATLMIDAEEARRVGQINAEKVLVQARQFRSSQKALAAASGFITDTGTSETLSAETENLAQADALAILFDAGNKYVSGKVGSENMIETGVSNARQYGQEGANRANALQGQATGTLLGSFASFASNSFVQKAAGLKVAAPSGVGNSILQK